MGWLRHRVVLLALMLAVASCQCVADCFTAPASDGHPAGCPRHSSSKQGSAPAGCGHAALLADLRAPHAAAGQFVAVTSSVSLGMPVWHVAELAGVDGVRGRAAGPPIFFRVLRV